jgi:hypothetical protein
MLIQCYPCRYITPTPILGTTAPFPAGASVKYAIKGIPALPTGITLDEHTGVITIAKTTSVQTQTSYTIEATPAAGTNYKGTQETIVKITIKEESIAGYTISYTDTSIEYSIGGEINPTTTFPLNSVSYGTGVLPTGITLDTTTGIITIGTTAGVQDDTTYTITATGIGLLSYNLLVPAPLPLFLSLLPLYPHSN